MSSYSIGAAAGFVMLSSIFTPTATAQTTNSIPPADTTTGNLIRLEHNKLVPSDPASAACGAKIVEYFSPAQLEAINTQLATLKNWMNDNYFFDSGFIEDVLGEEDDQSGIKQALYDAYNNIMSYHSVYYPGTEMGLVYLKDPVATTGAIFAYTDYATQLRPFLQDTDSNPELLRLQKDIDMLRGYAESTESKMVDQIARGCSYVVMPS